MKPPCETCRPPGSPDASPAPSSAVGRSFSPCPSPLSWWDGSFGAATGSSAPPTAYADPKVAASPAAKAVILRPVCMAHSLVKAAGSRPPTVQDTPQGY